MKSKLFESLLKLREGDDWEYDDSDEIMSDDITDEDFAEDGDDNNGYGSRENYDYAKEIRGWRYTPDHPSSDRWGQNYLEGNSDASSESQVYADAGEWAGADPNMDTDDEYTDVEGIDHDAVEYDKRKSGYVDSHDPLKHKFIGDDQWNFGGAPEEIDVPDDAKWYD